MPDPMQITDLRCEYQVDPLGIDVRQPRLSWQLRAGEPGQRGLVQSAYQVRVTDDGGELWNTGKVTSDQSVHVPYEGPALCSGQRCAWQVRAWDGDGQPSEWSEPATWEVGLLESADWQAEWIEPGWPEDPEAMHPCPYLRQTFTVEGEVRQARLYVTSHGLYELYLNGRRVGDQVFTPGYTSYHHRLQYQTYDVGDLLVEGENATGAILGDGWWRGKLGVEGVRNTYGPTLALLFQLHIIYADGSEQVVVSDGDWRATTGPILQSDLKDGEVYDARREMPGWHTSGFDDGDWRGVVVVGYGYDNLVAPVAPPIRRQETFRPAAILRTPAGQTVADLGQNIAGRVRLRVRGPAGTTVRLQHGEALDRAGNISLKHLQLSIGDKLLQEVQYTLRGDGEEVYEPHFTFHGFRYVLVEGYPGDPSPDDLTGIAIYSDMSPTGTFECSNPLVNRLQSNIVWSQKGNFLDIPTDCPQRERAGWTGDAQIFARTGSFLMDTAGFLTKWLRDLAADQHEDGLVPNLVPDPCAPSGKGGVIKMTEGSAGWGDAAVIVPWTMVQCYGDRRILEEQYASMKAWVEYMRAQARNVHWTKRLNPAFWLGRERRRRQPYLWDTRYHWGEWLEPGSSTASTFLGIIRNFVFSQPLVASAYFAYSTRLLAQTAQLLGKEADAQEYQALHAAIRAAYAAEFVGPDGRIKPHKQASYVRALALDLLPVELRPAAARHLVALIRSSGDHLGTGFLSTPFLCHVLADSGHLDVAYDLLNQETIPSWLYPVTKGATTIWESWDGIKEDGSVFGSLNHYSYGAIGSWLYQVVAGIDIGAPGYKQILIQPRPGGGLTHARASYQSLYGEVSSAWTIEDGVLRLSVTVPPNTTAKVRLPAATLADITEGGQPLADRWAATQREGAVSVLVGSGRYEFAYSYAAQI